MYSVIHLSFILPWHEIPFVPIISEDLFSSPGIHFSLQFLGNTHFSGEALFVGIWESIRPMKGDIYHHLLLFSHSVMSDCNSLQPHELQSIGLLCPWDFPGDNTGVGCHFLLQGSSWPRDQTQVSCVGRWILYHWGTWESHVISYKTIKCIVKAIAIPVVMYRHERWTIKKAEHQRIDFFKLCCWRRLLSPLDSKEIKPVHPKGNQPWICIGRTDAETRILWPPNTESQLTRKDSDAGKDWGQEEKGTTEGEMVGWHHWLNIHEFEQTPGDMPGVLQSVSHKE